MAVPRLLTRSSLGKNSGACSMNPSHFDQFDIDMFRNDLNDRHTKRERSQNWGLSEKFLLVRLVHKRLDVVEDKAADTDAVQRRKQAWRDIHAEFTAKVHTPGGAVQRSVQRVREQWRRIKHWARQEMNYILETQGQMDGKPRSNSKKHIDLAQYICDMMAKLETTNHHEQGFRSLVSRFQPETRRSEEGNVSLPDEPLQSHLNQGSASEVLQGEERLVTKDTVQVKKEGVENLDKDEATVTMVTTLAHSPPSDSVSQQLITRDNGHASMSTQELPSWADEFPEIVGESATQRTTVAEDEDEDEEEDDDDFLEDSDEDMSDSYPDWDREVPLSGRAYDRPDTAAPRVPSEHIANLAKLEKQKLLFARWEFKRRMQMLEEEHSRKMHILELQRETAQMKKKLVFRQLKKTRATSSAISNPYSRRIQMQ
ncbi:uncharacterized protein LOC110985257 [Acanthaster planci]|uniref:Uncharacterized protein LOC110985257 n=1 Tax=Acanthaster planci TaxID=133434 RepID=A0A8B7Z862_ACAPL|nr:uncharacterized protein LOC110985257 [Acanthaster planci]